jgi:hypothetical protein
MTTTAAKLWFGTAVLATVAFIAYGFGSDWDWFGAVVLGNLVLLSLLLGILANVVREGTVAVDATEGRAPFALPAAWPALGAVGAGCIGIGLAGRNALLWVGVGVLAVVLGEWLVQGWAERATADPAYNRELRHRIMLPVEIPVTAALIVGGVLITLSRVFLAVSVNGSRAIAIAVASVILALAFVIAYRPKVSTSLVGGLLAVGAVALLAAGIVGGVAGEREFHDKSGEVEHQSDTTGGDETGSPETDSTSTTEAGGH